MENQFDNIPDNNVSNPDHSTNSYSYNNMNSNPNNNPNNYSDNSINDYPGNTDTVNNYQNPNQQGYGTNYQNMYQHSVQNGNPYGDGGQQYQQANNSYNQNNGYNQNYYVPNNGYQPNQNNQNSGMDTSPMTMGDWLLTTLALLIPCAGIILYFVWAFGSHGNINRRNYCRAQLIMMGIILAIYIIVVIILVASLAGALSMY